MVVGIQHVSLKLVHQLLPLFALDGMRMIVKVTSLLLSIGPDARLAPGANEDLELRIVSEAQRHCRKSALRSSVVCLLSSGPLELRLK